MAGKPKRSVAEVIEAARHCRGLVHHMAERLDVAVATVYSYRAKHPTVAQAIDDQRGRALDDAELQVFKAVSEGQEWACKFLLGHLGASRGYVQRLEIVLARAVAEAAKLSDDELWQLYERSGLGGGAAAGPGRNGRAEPPAAADAGE